MNRSHFRPPSLALKITLLMALLLCQPVTILRADTEESSSFSFIIPEIRMLSLETGTSVCLADTNALLTGWTEVQTWDIVVSSNVDWVLTVRGTQSAWEGPWPKPVSDIWWACDSGDFVPLDTAPLEGCSGGPSDHESHPVHFRIAMDMLQDIPGDYFYGYIVFELAAP